jgi:hypothetical protein
MRTESNHCQAFYEIVIQGELDPSWEQWFSGLSVTLSSARGQSPTTTIAGPVVDQAALRGMLCKLWDLNMTLLSLRRMETDGKKEEDHD